MTTKKGKGKSTKSKAKRPSKPTKSQAKPKPGTMPKRAAFNVMARAFRGGGRGI